MTPETETKNRASGADLIAQAKAEIEEVQPTEAAAELDARQASFAVGGPPFAGEGVRGVAADAQHHGRFLDGEDFRLFGLDLRHGTLLRSGREESRVVWIRDEFPWIRCAGTAGV